MTKAALQIIDYREELAPHFKELNKAWLEKYFYVEPVDEVMLSNPKAYIIEKGGFIYFIQAGDVIVGTFAFIKLGGHEYELSKMAVNEQHQGGGIGNWLLERALEKAKEIGASKIILYSNTLLQPAIHLYKKYGFKETALDTTEYKRANIKMEKLIL